MAVKRYNGSSWDVVAGLGAQGQAATSSSIATWVKTASGGETSLSGNDDNSQSLSYTVGQELVFINGALQKRGVDYTATTGTSITGLTALAASDVVTVWTVNAFSVTNAISNTLVDAKGDLITATGADVPARLAVGTNGQYLKADSTTSTGLSWATLPSSGKVLQVVQSTTTTLTSIASTTWTDTGLSASITPSATTSKILVLTTQPMYGERLSPSTQWGGGVRLMRGSTNIFGDTAASNGYSNFYFQTLSNGVGGAMYFNVNFTYLDSPSTTSSTTYKTQASSYSTSQSGKVDAQPGSNPSSIILMEIGA